MFQLRMGLVAGISALIAVAFSGCTTGADPGASGQDVTLITDPNDFSYLQNETAMNDRAHVHDYWGGQDRLTVHDETFGCGSQLLSDPVICDHRPSDPIPLGTGVVEVTVDWTLHADRVSDYDDTELWVKTANDTESHPIGLIDNGDTVTFEVTNEQDDLPHQRMSAWQFDLYVWGDRDAPYPLTNKMFYADVHMEVVAVRTLEIPFFPGHPDIWQNRTEMPLVTDYRYPASAGHFIDGDEVRAFGSATAADDRRIRPDEGVIVPSDASYIDVVVEQVYETGSDRVYLRFHGADERPANPNVWDDWLEPELVADDGFTQVYRIHIEGSGDSPYALQSMWEFYTIFDGAEGDPIGGDFYKGHYTVQATVYREPAA